MFKKTADLVAGGTPNHPVSYPHPERVGHAHKAEKEKNPEVEIVIFTKKRENHNRDQNIL